MSGAGEGRPVSGRVQAAQVLVTGSAEGDVLVLSDALSLWGGVDEASGVVIDAHHPQRGEVLAGRIVVMPGGRGSSSSSSVLAELVRAGMAPAAILLGERDPILALGAAVAEALYGRTIPVLVLDAAGYAWATDARRLRVDPSGWLDRWDPGG